MLMKSALTAAGLFAAIAGLPLAASNRTESCTPTETSPAAYAQSFPREGADLLHAIEVDANTVLNESDLLLHAAPPASRQFYSEHENTVRDSVNDMGQRLCRLEVIRETLPDWQQQAVRRAEPAVVEMANYARSAVRFLNEHPTQMFSRDYTNLEQYLFVKAGQLSNSLRQFTQYAKASEKEMRLEQVLGVKKAD